MLMEEDHEVAEGMIDVDKLRKLSRTIQTCTNAQDVIYNLEAVPPLIIFFLSNLEVLEEEACYQLSMEREPRESK